MADLVGRRQRVAEATEALKAIGRSNGGDNKIVRIRDTLAAAVSAYTLVSNFYNNAKNKAESFNFSVYIEEDDEIFDDLQLWLLEQIPAVKQKHLRAYTSNDMRRKNVAPWDDDFEDGPVRKNPWVVILENTAARPFGVVIDGHAVDVSYEEPEASLSTDGNNSNVRFSSQAKLNFICKSAEARDAVVALFDKLAAEYSARHQNSASVFRCTGYGSWTRYFGPPRKLETVALDGDLKDDILMDLRRFLGQEQRYSDLGLPYHRGYMLHGPPGTGKTSLARGLASHLGLDLYYIPLSDVKKDADLSDLLGRVNRGLLLLEDIDVVKAATTRSDEGDGVSMTGLLNALDGAVTPHGLVTIMTTNRLDAIDDALIRPGRADRVIELGYLTNAQVDTLMRAMLPKDAWCDLPSVKYLKMTAADIVEKIKYHMDDDPDTIVKEIADLIHERRKKHGK